ncbi:Fur family transcriptional regulator [Methyloligella sp. 2.7D]|uniref:Fur family transcriptional regulator n=1 Tax=unclassified Methyloligella TaxID=2625955 RepID=UPI00157D84B4|nr:Fur family transcriptional regulator [Methyloligella sp. GL2]QKP76446.1 transcriptional repressor [Methyloligella sp. GL2]
MNATKPHDHSHDARDLSPNQERVLSCLQRSKEPMSAYAILDEVRPEGISHPPTVYRALKELEALGMVHRLKSLSAFVACRMDGCGGHHAFAFCRKCQKVVEVALDEERYTELLGLAPGDIKVDQVTLELAGLCTACRAVAS